jgi:Flp pilus assembly protein TadG
MMIPKKRRIRRQQLGAVVVETAVALPVFLIFVFGIMEYSRFLMVRNMIDHAAREGARFAVVRADEDATTQEIVDYVNDRLRGLGTQVQAVDIQVFEANSSDGSNLGSWRDAAFGESIAVRVTGDYLPITGSLVFMPDVIPLQACAMMRSEAN